MQQSRLQYVIEVIQRANQIAASTQLDALLEQMLDLIIQVTGAESGTLFLYEAETDELVFKVVKEAAASRTLLGERISAAPDKSIAGYTLTLGEGMYIPDVHQHPLWAGNRGTMQLRTMYCLPLRMVDHPVGVVEVFNPNPLMVDDPDETAILRMLADRLANEVEKVRLLEDARRREKRQQALVDIISHITRTLDRDQLLDKIMNHARDLLEVEATSIWLRDEKNGDLVLHIATGDRSEQMKEVRVPPGEGIIGSVVESGHVEVVLDAATDPRVHKKTDEQSGFKTKSILCVPLRAASIQLGAERGELQETIIGGAQALNKRNNRRFTSEDVALMETLASQAATVLRLSMLYTETSDLYFGIIDVVTGSLDLRDPDTAGHSQRVSDFAVAIAREMNLPPDVVYHIRIGGMLHDIGKIGIPDAILAKPGMLTDEEREVMKSHPSHGVLILERNEKVYQRLRDELLAVSEHHERLDGRGYPHGRSGAEISLIGRIMAVADVFDAITSDRRYRKGMPVDQVIAILHKGIGTEFDGECVAALVRAREKGTIVTQQEREPS